ncbi:hypothetical protein Zmor_020005 [Zophobas morio]|uniref:Uncharacterized protein n=1 Tax=Zophobas morio TaxID=2755281 RepID=A0AA38I3D4_9CUCU|nr:hypothetical protein Zmor_020005 [Zophobas morio]
MSNVMAVFRCFNVIESPISQGAVTFGRFLHIIEPNIRLPLVSIRLTAITERRKKIKPKKEVRRRQRQRHFLSCFMRLLSSSERGTSRVKSASGRPPG